MFAFKITLPPEQNVVDVAAVIVAVGPQFPVASITASTGVRPQVEPPDIFQL